MPRNIRAFVAFNYYRPRTGNKAAATRNKSGEREREREREPHAGAH